MAFVRDPAHFEGDAISFLTPKQLRAALLTLIEVALWEVQQKAYGGEGWIQLQGTPLAFQRLLAW